MPTRLIHDTGTGLSIIGAAFYDDYLRSKVPLHNSQTIASAANGQRLTVRGECRILLSIGPKVEFHWFKVIEELGSEIIIGTDIMTDMKMSLNFHSGRLKFMDTGETVPMIWEVSQDTEQQNVSILTAERIVIPARHVIRIPVKVKGNVSASNLYDVYTPLHIFAKRHCYIRSGILDDRKAATVEVINVTNYPIILEATMPIGIAVPTSEVLLVGQQPCKADLSQEDINNILKQIDSMDLDIDCELTQTQKEQLRAFLRQHAQVFSPNPKGPSRTTAVKHPIDTGEAKPIKQRAYRLSPAENEKAVKEIQEMLAQNVIRKSKSPWASPIVLVRKPDGSTRFCVDYRKLNAVTKRDVYPLPLIEETLDKMRGINYFSSLDLASGFWQVEIEEKDKEKTAFVCSAGLFEFNVMPFGLTNAPATFQRMMDEVIADMDWRVGSDYIDDLIVGSLTFEEHLSNLASLFKRLTEYGLTVKLSKCSFGKHQLVYLGHRISKEGISPNPAKTAAIDKMQQPKNISALRRFLGMTNYYRRFIHHYADLAAPLNKLLQKDSVWKWSDACQLAFDTLKDHLRSSPILAYPDFSKPFILHTDASIVGLGAVLVQEQNNKEVVIAYASRAVTKDERKWGITELECLAVIWGLKIFRPYIYGRTITVVTDHEALTSLKSKRDELTGRLGRWALKLQEYDLEIKHRPGKLHGDADALSRMDGEGVLYRIHHEGRIIPVWRWERWARTIYRHKPNLQRRSHASRFKRTHQVTSSIHNSVYYINQTTAAPTDYKDYLQFSNDNMRAAQQGDALLGPIYAYLLHGELPENAEDSTVKEASGYELDNGLLYRVVPTPKMVNSDLFKLRLAIPENYIDKVLEQSHGSILAGHLGVKKTYERIAQQYYWRGMLSDVKRHIKACMPCAMRKGLPDKNMGQMGTIESFAPWDIIGADIVGPLPKTSRGHRYLLVFTDHFTKYAEAFPVEKQDADTIATIYIKHIICRYGTPKQILTDRGKAFIGQVMTRVCKRLNINQLRTSSVHPQTNGLTERFNKTLIGIISMFVSEHQKDWDMLTPYALYAYNTSLHPSTRFTPFYLMFGRDPNLVDADIPESSLHNYDTVADRNQHIETQFAQIRERVQYYNNLAAQKRIRFAEKTRKDVKYEIGDTVWVYNKQIKKGQVKKLSLPWHGPFRIQKFIGPVTVLLQNEAKRTIRQPVHVSRLKLYESAEKTLEVQELPSDGDINYDFGDDVDQELDKKERDKAATAKATVPIDTESEANANQTEFSGIISLPGERNDKERDGNNANPTQVQPISGDKLAELAKDSEVFAPINNLAEEIWNQNKDYLPPEPTDLDSDFDQVLLAEEEVQMTPSGEYEVERILNHRIRKGLVQYFVRWKGYTPTHDCWLNQADMGNCYDLIEEYRERNPEEPQKPKNKKTKSTTSKSKEVDKKGKTLEEEEREQPHVTVNIQPTNIPVPTTVTSEDNLMMTRRRARTAGYIPADSHRRYEAEIMLRAAENVRKTNCTICGFIAQNNKGLRNHMKTNHAPNLKTPTQN